MRQWTLFVSVIASLGVAAGIPSYEPAWSFNAEYIEACSCDLFCPCYWSTSPDKDFCKFNMAVRVQEGHYGETKLDGLKFWVSGDLGDNFGDGETEVVQFAFEPSATEDQIKGVVAILGSVYPVRWKKVVGIERTAIEWKKEADKAYAKRADGKGEMRLTFVKGQDGTPVVIKNMAYFGAKKNDGFNIARAHHTAKVGDDSFSFDNSTGFYIVLHTENAK